MLQRGHSRIVSVGYYLPECTVRTSHILEEVKAETISVQLDELEQRMGVTTVRHSACTETQSDLAAKASEQALQKSSVNPWQVDYIIYCGVEGDYTEPATAHAVQHKLGLRAACFDVANACLGFTTGMQIADSMIASGSARYVLVCTGEKLSELTKAVVRELRRQPDVATLRKKLGFLAVGDAGGAVLIGPKEGTVGFQHFQALSYGGFADLCYYRMNAGLLDGQMVMDKISAKAIRAHRDLYSGSMDYLNWTPSSVNCLITHQVGRRMFERLSEVFAVGKERMTKSYDVFGNIATATFAVNYGRALESGMIRAGDRVFCGMSGSGLAVCQVGMTV